MIYCSRCKWYAKEGEVHKCKGSVMAEHYIGHDSDVRSESLIFLPISESNKKLVLNDTFRKCCVVMGDSYEEVMTVYNQHVGLAPYKPFEELERN